MRAARSRNQPSNYHSIRTAGFHEGDTAIDGKRGQELADFLRTAGLRGVEVAVLAGMSETWDTWLEQAHDVRPSTPEADTAARIRRQIDARRRPQTAPVW